LLLLALGVAAAGSGCVADASGEKAVSTTSVTVPDSVPEQWADLEGLLPAEAPAGFEKSPDGLARAGAIDVPRAVEVDGRPDAQTFFTDQRFLRGYQRRFVDGTGTRHVDVWIYQFEAPENAAAWLLRTVGQTREGGSGLDAGTIPGASGARKRSPDGTIAVIAYPAGDRAVRVESQDPDPAIAATRARDEARQMRVAVPPSEG
jgi:hypothetical protein